MNFIILADKFNKGMKSRGCLGLLDINKKYNILEFQYSNIKKIFPKAKIIYVYGFDHKKMQSFLDHKKHKDLIGVYNPDYENYNYTHSISLTTDYLNDSCFITFGDIIFKYQTFKTFAKDKNQSQIFINSKIPNQFGCTIINNNVINISFGLENYLSHIYYICKKDIEHLTKLVHNTRFKNYFIFEIINKMIDSNISFTPIINNNKTLTKHISEIKIKI